ncbi:MAG: Dabb family protein [Bacteroidales bacterium]
MNPAKTLLTLFIVAIMFSLTSCQENRSIDLNFCHHVYFWLNNPDNPADRETFENGIAELLEIPEIKSYHFGIPAPGTVDREVVDGSYTYSYLIFFDSPEAQDIYQDHPLHHKFIDNCSHLWDRVVVYDSVLK